MTDEQSVVQTLLARVDELESRIALRDLVSNYCHGFDKRDFDRFLSIWWEDCVWDVGPPFGRFESHQGIRNAIHDVLWPAWRQSQHLTTNLYIEFDDPDNARGVCDVDCMGLLMDADECQVVGATYRDHFQRREGSWRILERKVEIHYFNPLPGSTLSKPQ